MPPKANANIAAFFPPKGQAKPAKQASTATKTATPDRAKAPQVEPEAKGKGKRPSSPSRSASSPAPKRLNNEPSTSTRTHFSPKHLSADWLPADTVKDAATAPPKLSLTVYKGDLFSGVPPNALLIHACNTQGSWGAGIARAFRDRYPKAYAIYRNYCTKEHDPKINPIPIGTTLLIPPVDAGKTHWIGCLFTSAKYGKAKARPEQIVRNTIPAMQMLLEFTRMAGDVEEVRMCKINSGLFGVRWEDTAEAVEGIVLKDGWKSNVDVWAP